MMAQRVATRWIEADSKREIKKRDTWAKKLRGMLETAARKGEGLDPDDLHVMFGRLDGSWNEPPSGYDFDLIWGFSDDKVELKVSVWFEEGESKRYRVEATVQGKRLPVVERTARRLKVPDFFKAFQAYLKAHKDELLTGDSKVWHSTDPSGNRFFGLTKGSVDWRGGYADYFIRLSPEMQDEIIMRTEFAGV